MSGGGVRVTITDRSSGAGDPLSLEGLARLGEAAIPACRAAALGQAAPLLALGEVEVALLGDAEMAAIHEEFMAVPGSTDVITFHHGEILICPEEARRQAPAHDEPFAREMARYLVHGLLHLAGHDDLEETEKWEMHRIQEQILVDLWEDFGAAVG